MTNKIFRSTVFIAAVVLICSLGIIMGALYDYLNAVKYNVDGGRVDSAAIAEVKSNE